MKQFKITTNDNPYDPFEDFENWFAFDIEKGYNSCSILDRTVNVEDNFSELEIANEVERAIDKIIKYDFTDTYKKVVKEFADLEDES